MKQGFLILISIAMVFSQENYSTWSFYKEITVNTTATGANVIAAQTDFPLLVRLHAANAGEVFSQAASDGADIRFATQDGLVRLQHQKERWDPANQLAEFWVSIPSVAGNSSTAFRMYWGKTGEADSSNGPAVFDTANKYQAVWHMNGASDTSNETDATINGFTAMQVGSPTAGTTGGVGPARTLANTTGGANAATQYFTTTGTTTGILNFPEGGPYTLSAWVTSSNNAQRTILGKGDSCYGLNLTSGLLFEGADFESTRGYRVVRAPAAPALDSWYHLVFVRDGTNPGAESLYVNGVLINGTPNLAVINTANRSQGYDIVLGANDFLTGGEAHNYRRGWSGVLDEIQLSSTNRAAGWVKLSYETQKAGATAALLGATQTLTAIGRFPGLESFPDNFKVIPVGAALLFRLPTGKGLVRLSLNDIRGRVVWKRDLALGPETQEIAWKNEAPSGVYAARIIYRGTSSGIFVRKVYKP